MLTYAGATRQRGGRRRPRRPSATYSRTILTLHTGDHKRIPATGTLSAENRALRTATGELDSPPVVKIHYSLKVDMTWLCGVRVDLALLPWPDADDGTQP